MSLLMLKTHDLSWQDHTVNIEVMLAPTRNQLLFNKHKTLETKCNAVKRVYDKEKQTLVKDFTIRKRMMERKQQALFRRRSEILFQRVASGSADDRYSKSRNVPNTSGKRRLTSAPPQLEGDSDKNTTRSVKSAFFVTQTTNDYNSPSNLSEFDTRPVSKSRMISPDRRTGDVTPLFSAFSSNSRTESVSPFSSKRVKSVRFEGNDFINENKAHTETPRVPIQDRVTNFCKAQSEFNSKPPVTFRKRESLYKDSYREPLIAKRYSSVKNEKSILEDAFNDMCINGSTKEDFKTLVKVASKIKANAKLARNQSIVPSMAAFKATKSFKEVLGRSSSVSPREAHVY